MKNAAQVILFCLFAAACGARGAEPVSPPADAGGSGRVDEPASLEIAGLVKAERSFTVGDLRRMEPVEARANEVHRDGEFFGSYTVRGVPLRTLLDAAVVQKGASAFDKPLDL